MFHPVLFDLPTKEGLLSGGKHFLAAPLELWSDTVTAEAGDGEALAAAASADVRMLRDLTASSSQPAMPSPSQPASQRRPGSGPLIDVMRMQLALSRIRRVSHHAGHRVALRPWRSFDSLKNIMIMVVFLCAFTDLMVFVFVCPSRWKRRRSEEDFHKMGQLAVV